MDEKLVKQLDKLENLFKAVSADSGYITQQELEDVVALIIAALKTESKDTQNKIDDWRSEDEADDQKEYQKIYAALGELKDSFSEKLGGLENISREDVQKDIAAALSKVEWKKGDQGEAGLEGKAGKDGSPDTPDQVVEKVNASKILIKKDRIEGLLDIIANVAAQAVGAVGVTTTHFFRNGTHIGRAKNINIIEGNNVTATLYQTGDQMNISLSATGGGSSLTWVSDEVPSGSGTSFTIANTPASGTFKLFRGGAKQQSIVDFTLSGTTLTLTTALATGEVLLCDYGY